MAAQAGPDLRAVDHVVVAIADRAGLGVGQIRALIGLRKALAPDVIGIEDATDVALLVGLGADRQNQRAGPVQADGVGHERQFLARHLGVDDVLVSLRPTAAAIGCGPCHPEVAGLVDLALPVAQVGELGFIADLQGGFGQQETRVWWPVVAEPGFNFAAELKQIGHLGTPSRMHSGIASTAG